MSVEVVSDLAALFEAVARGLLRRKHAKHVKTARGRIKAVLAAYFRRQEAAVLEDIRPRIAAAVLTHPAPVKESNTGKSFAQNVLPDSVVPLRFLVTDTEQTDFAAAVTDAMTAAAKTVGRELGSKTALGDDVVASYLRHNSLTKLTGDFSATSVDRLRNAIADAWEDGGSYDQIVKAVQDTFEDFSDVRAGMIAQTEAVDAYNAGREATARAAGASEKSWETESGNPCETCLANEADGWIPIDDTFTSGDDAPTAHVNCQCVLNFRTGG